MYEDETCIEFLMYDEASGEEKIKYFVHYSFPKDESGAWDSLVADVPVVLYLAPSKYPICVIRVAV